VASFLSPGWTFVWTYPFGGQLTTSHHATQALEGMGNHSIKLDPRLWNRPESLGPRTQISERYNLDSLRLRSFVEFSDYVKDVDGLLPKIRVAYNTVREDRKKLKAILSDTPLIISAEGYPTTEHLPLLVRRIHLRQQTSYSILLLLAIMCNSALLERDPLGEGLEEDSELFVDEVITTATEGLQYRPLGSSAMPISLIGAWTATKYPDKHAKLEELLLAYQSDFSSVRWLEIATSLKPKLTVVEASRTTAPGASACISKDLCANSGWREQAPKNGSETTQTAGGTRSTKASDVCHALTYF
jgi:hypothetical protein